MLRITAQGCTFVPFDSVRILPAQLGEFTGLIGAACAFWQRTSVMRDS